MMREDNTDFDDQSNELTASFVDERGGGAVEDVTDVGRRRQYAVGEIVGEFLG